MVTENIDIVIREKGARVVKRKLEDIGEGANRATRGLRLLQNSLFVLGAAGALSALQRSVDTLTNFENRIRLVTDSTQELNDVQNELFEISKRTRTSFESSAEVFTRVALSVRNLGVSNKETLQFTESLNKAVILSGASAREAEAAMVQLGQGLASNRLSGDELRSVLEQLPFVADVIAKSLKITRGELRQFGKDGKITALTVTKAFRDSREEIAEKFAKTVPTISQAFSVFRVNLLQTLDTLDDMTSSSELLAKAIIGLGGAMGTLLVTTIALGTAFAAFKFSGFIQGAITSIAVGKELAVAVASGNAVLLNSIEIERAKSTASLASAQASKIANVAKIRDIKSGIVQLQQNKAIILQQQIDTKVVITNRKARSALTGQFVNLSAAVRNNIGLNRALLLTERALVTSKAQLTTATTAQTVATNALSGAQARSVAASVASGTLTAKLARSFPLLSGAILTSSRALAGLGAIAVANPVGAAVAGITAAVIALTLFSDRIKVSEDGIVRLRDVAIASFQIIAEAIKPVTDIVGLGMSLALDKAISAWNVYNGFLFSIWGGLLSGVKDLTNLIIASFVFQVKVITKVWDTFPALMKDIAILTMNGFIQVIEDGTNGVLSKISSVFEAIDDLAKKFGKEAIFGDAFKDLSIDLGEFKGKVSGVAQEVGETFSKEFTDSFGRDFIGEGINAILDRARTVATNRLSNLKDQESATDGSGKAAADFLKVINLMKAQNDALKVNSRERKILTEIIRIEKKLKRELTDIETGIVRGLLEENQALKVQASILDELNDPLQTYNDKLSALNELLSVNKISQGQFTQSLREARIAYLDSQRDLASGFERGFLKSLDSASNFASKSEALVTNSVDGMSKAFADFVVDGEADFKSLLNSINKQLVQLLASQAFSKLFGDENGSGGLLGFITGIASGASGGSGSAIGSNPTLPNANGNAFSNGNVLKFQKGGIVDTATSFGMSRNRQGVMGEAGPEGILPLSRTREGKLGVEVANQQPQQIMVQPIINIENNTDSEVSVESSQGPTGESITTVILSTVKGGITSGAFDPENAASPDHDLDQ